MSKPKAEKTLEHLTDIKPSGNLRRYTEHIKGKVLEELSITNELECRVISMLFQDRTELAITIDIKMLGRIELFDVKTGDLELTHTLGRIPDDSLSTFDAPNEAGEMIQLSEAESSTVLKRDPH